MPTSAPTSREEPAAESEPAFDPAPYMQRLPARVRGRGGGEKTHAVLVNPDGTTQEIVSGEHDPEFERANDHARRIGLVPGAAKLWITSHAEIKAAMRMRPGQRADLVINNPMCPGRLGCAALLSKFLPSGAKLTVHGPNGFRKTFEGKSDNR